MNRRRFLSVAAMGALAACGSNGSNGGAGRTGVEQISVTELNKRIGSQPNLVVLDVRTPAEFVGDGHIKGARLIPVQELEQRLAEVPTDQPVACICRSGNRSTTACDLLAKKGYTQISNVQGGMIAWGQAGLPIER